MDKKKNIMSESQSDTVRSASGVLCELQEKFPGVKISDASVEAAGSLKTRVEVFERFIIHLYEMSRLLWVTDKKFRVTIECDPETGEVSAKREYF